MASRLGSIRAHRMSSIRGQAPGDNSAALGKQKPVLLQHGLVVVDTIATGGQGEVLRCHYRPKSNSETGDGHLNMSHSLSSPSATSAGYTVVAVKFIRCSSSKHRDETLREVEMLRLVRHPNVVTLLDCIEDRNAVYVVTEMLNGGDLLDRILRGAFSDAQVLFFAEKVLSILVDIHRIGITHRDLKLENFMLHTDETTGEEVIKLIDLGMAHRRNKGDPALISDEHPGTLMYEAPEIVRREPYSPEKVDIWCTGVMLYTAAQKTYPFSDEVESEVSRQILEEAPRFDGSQWKHLGQPFEDLIKSMLNKNASKRPTAKEALATVAKIRRSRNQAASASRMKSSESKSNIDNVSLSKKEGFLSRMKRSISLRMKTNGKSVP
mmetsp:Transcript_5179/g.9035  ORF Transcript_5179/g.9035 Transcript_5179/m.9035 type:complete len:380 (+) Transcript_5179:53-1192(+)